MPEARVQLAIEIETEGAEQLTSLRRELEQLGQAGQAAFTRLDAALGQTVDQLEQSRALVGSTLQEFLDSHRRLFSSLDPVFQGFFRRLLTGARSFSDALKRLLSDLLRYFLRTLEQIVAGWFSGFRRMGAPPVLGSGLGGGILPSALGLLLESSGGLRTAGVGGTPPTFPTGGGGGSATNLNLLSQLGIPTRDLTIGGFTLPGGLLASGGLLLGLTGVLRGSPLLGAAGGALAGFAFGGPIGAAIGALAGLFGGLFSRGKKKRHDTRVFQAGLAEMQKVLEEFKRFRVDFEAALAQVDAIWAEMASAFKLKRSLRGAEPRYLEIRRQIEDIEKQRELRGGLLRALPIPEFAAGGFVADQLRAIQTGQGKVLAFLHQGEAVLNSRAVAALGRSFIEQVNRAPSFQSGGFVSRPLSPSRSFGTATGRTVNIGPIIIQAAPGMNEEALANFTIRKLRRELRDKGIIL
jgi:hypothetical protein